MLSQGTRLPLYKYATRLIGSMNETLDLSLLHATDISHYDKPYDSRQHIGGYPADMT